MDNDTGFISLWKQANTRLSPIHRSKTAWPESKIDEAFFTSSSQKI